MPIAPPTFQLIAALLLALTLVYLARLVRQRPAADWALGWLALAVGLLAVEIYIGGGPRTMWPIYLLSEWTFLGLLVVGCRDFATGRRPRRAHAAWVIPLAVLLSIALSRKPVNFNELFRIHAGIMSAGFGTAFVILREAQRGPRAAVVGAMRTALAALTMLFASYVVLFGLNSVPWWLSYSSFADSLLENALGMGMLLAISGEVQRALEEDVRRRAQAEAEIRHQHREFRELIEAMPVAVLAVRGDQLALANAAASRILQFNPDELRRRSLSELAHPEDRALLLTLASGDSGMAGARDVRLMCRDNSVVVLEMAARQRVLLEGAPTTLLTAVDVTERRSITQRLMVSERLASLGTLAGGIAHEINNPLAVVVYNLHYARSALEGAPSIDDGTTLDTLNEAAHGAERVRRIVRDVMAFSRLDADVGGPIDLREVVRSSLRIAGGALQSRGRVIEDLDELPPVVGNEAAFGQVLLALLTNATQAITGRGPEHGEIRVTTRARFGAATVEIRDNGVGIAPENLTRIFDPFFTTREVGQGTGMGLTLAHTTIAAAGGTIDVESQVGRGTVFRITLPSAVTASKPPGLGTAEPPRPGPP